MICKCKFCGAEDDGSGSLFYKGNKSTCKKCAIKRGKERAISKREEIKEYRKKYHQEHLEDAKRKRNEYREKVYALKTPCIKCGETRPWILDFHHIDPSKKSFDIPRKHLPGQFDVIEAEIKKCVCLCRNCHQEFHYFYGESPKDPVASLNEYLSTPTNQLNFKFR